MKILKHTLFFSLLMNINFVFAANTGARMNDLKWFQNFGCSKLQITQFHSLGDMKVEKQVVVTDSEYINSFQLQINRLPVSGDEMIKMGPNAKVLSLEFTCKDKPEIITFYNSHIQTPATSFYAKPLAAEKVIWDEIQMHFEKPAINKPYPQVKNKVNDFGDFTIAFIGSEDRTPQGTTASLYVDTFKVVNKKDKKEQMVEISSGQLPARPEAFTVNDQHLVLSTFADKKGDRLEARMFMIYKK